jgi:hypothetical protein
MIFLAIHIVAVSQVPAPEPAVDNQMQLTQLMNFLTVNRCGTVVLEVDSLGTITINGDYFLDAFLGLWQQYKAECYADSTREMVSQFGSNPGSLVYHPPELEWTHKEYSGTGFLNWLEEKTK